MAVGVVGRFHVLISPVVLTILTTKHCRILGTFYPKFYKISGFRNLLMFPNLFVVLQYLIFQNMSNFYGRNDITRNLIHSNFFFTRIFMSLNWSYFFSHHLRVFSLRENYCLFHPSFSLFLQSLFSKCIIFM